MLDLDRLSSIRLSARPIVQRLLAVGMLTPNYLLPPRVRIRVEGREHLPDEPVIYAMNHTDRYNYWPFQYWLWRHERRFTATWVKGKYYENPALGRFMALTNNIPAPSRGYVLTKDFALTVGRTPSDEEYRALQAVCDGGACEPGALPEEVLSRPRNLLGCDFEPGRESYGACVARLLGAMTERFVELNQECFDKGLDLLIFPQGTRSIRLSRGRIGLAQVALRFGVPIVPVGCSGSDRLYPGGSPWARGGRVTYRIGAPLRREDWAEHELPAGVDPFAADLAPEHRARMQGLVDRVMERINELVDPEYRFAEGREDGGGVTGASRFV